MLSEGSQSHEVWPARARRDLGNHPQPSPWYFTDGETETQSGRVEKRKYIGVKTGLHSGPSQPGILGWPWATVAFKMGCCRGGKLHRPRIQLEFGSWRGRTHPAFSRNHPQAKKRRGRRASREVSEKEEDSVLGFLKK